MENKIKQIQILIETEAKSVITSENFYDFKKKVFDNKNGFLSEFSKEIVKLDPKDRPEFGKKLHAIKTWATEFVDLLEKDILKKELEKRNQTEKIDITLPGKKSKVGAYNPLNLIIEELTDTFIGMGFEVYEGSEIENDYYNFTALNTPQDHPAREMQDTFYLSENFLLRSHTSPAQIHVMENKKPPIKIITPGKVFRADDDATHSPMFTQIEGLVVDKKVTLCDLKGMLELFLQKTFGEKVTTRLRPSYFPFTEPSVEVDVSCFECGGKGCRLCKQTGWIEILGAGMVHDNVLRNCGIDPNEYSGFAFGMGIERVAMLKYGINHIRLFFESDVRFLEQFKK